MKNNLVISITITLGVLLIPFVAMQFTSEVNWDRPDFVIMGILIFTTSLVLNLAMKKIQHNPKRLLVGVVIVALFIYIWAELAVGIFTNFGS
jgi:hypothetical protein